MLKRIFVFGIALSTLMTLQVVSAMDEIVIEPAGEANIEEYTQVTGKAAFEKRATIVPLAVCEGVTDELCPKSETYWVLVVKDGGLTYEVAQEFSKGEEKAPESVELAGTVVRPGSRLILDGRVRPISERYAILHDVIGASLVMDMYSAE